ncbi:hypothetical protein E4T56_gene2309 [Termitomyces sp. T112]|nr:hypothetical protein E4T56_gene2309 [Termitomyces sp. T112]
MYGDSIRHRKRAQTLRHRTMRDLRRWCPDVSQFISIWPWYESGSIDYKMPKKLKNSKLIMADHVLDRVQELQIHGKGRILSAFCRTDH